MRTVRQTRTRRLLALLLSRKGRRVALWEVQREAGAQHGARLAELRDRGYVIENILQHTPEQTLSWYVLRAEPGETALLFTEPE